MESYADIAPKITDIDKFVAGGQPLKKKLEIYLKANHFRACSQTEIYNQFKLRYRRSQVKKCLEEIATTNDFYSLDEYNGIKDKFYGFLDIVTEEVCCVG